ncbi:MAG: HAMP domain-containing protein, partial [Clostridia bacterium]|nr:HAMP domain-containing protein [Clostridia bacterium]
TERLTLYDNNANYIKDIAITDRTEMAKEGLPNKPYMVSFSISGSDVYLYGVNGKDWEVRKIDTIEKKLSEPLLKFRLYNEPNCTGDASWITSMVAIDDNRIAYATRTGKLFVMNSKQEFEDVTSSFNQGTDVFFSNMYSDSSGNLYVHENVKNTYSVYNAKSKTVRQIYNADSYLDKARTIKFGQTTNIYKLNSSKETSFIATINANDSLIMFGNREAQIDVLGNPIFPDLFIKFWINFGALLILGLVGIAVVKSIRKKTTVFLKVYCILMPLVVIATIVLGVVVYNSVEKQFKEDATHNQSMITAMAQTISEDDINTITANKFGTDEFKKIANKINTSYYKFLDSTNTESDHITLYRVKNGVIYSVVTFNNKKYPYNYIDKEADFFYSSVFNSGEEKLESDEDRIYDLLIEMENNSFPVSVYAPSVNTYDRMFSNEEGKWLATSSCIRNQSGNVIAILENSRLVDSLDEKLDRITGKLIISVLLINILLMAILAVLLRFIFKPIKALQKSISLIGTNNWHAKIEVKTNDEIGDLAVAFNFMSYKMSKYVSSLVRLNRTSMRFLPKEIFQLMGKQKISDVLLYDNMFKHYNFILVEFPYEHIGDKSIHKVYNEFFRKMNINFNSIYKIVDRNNGVIQNYDGRGMLIVIPNYVVDAFNMAIQLREFFVTSSQYVEPVKILLFSDYSLIGISGNESKNSITVLSTVLDRGYEIKSNISKLGIDLVVTDAVISSLKEHIEFDCRLIGRVKSAQEGKYIGLYELLSNMEVSKKNLYLQTRKIFEFGVNSYINADLYNARKAFSNVLAINEGDTVAMHYLVLCNENKDKSPINWEGTVL